MEVKRILQDDEIVFIFDFLIDMLRHAETAENISISLATHLLGNYYPKSDFLFKK